MKLKKIKKWTIITYFLLLIILSGSVPIYIYHKSENLKEQAYSVLDNFFAESYKYSYLENEPNKAFPNRKEKEIMIPQYNRSTSATTLEKEEWEKKYGDLYALYSVGDEFCYLKEGKTNSLFPLGNCCYTWCLYVIEKIEGGYIQYMLYPYQIGIKKQEYELLYNYTPSISKILEEAFEFYTTNQKSEYSKFYKGLWWDNILLDLNMKIPNGYYRITRDTLSPLFFTGGNFRNVDIYSKNRLPINNGYMYSDYYKVFMRKSQPITFRITKFKDVEQNEIKRILTTWGIRLTILFLIIYLLIFIKERKLKALAKEPLRSKLLRLCNPSQFMKPYNKEKVEKANSIYKELMNINENDTDKLKNIRNRAIQELEINLLDRNKVEMLKEKANPKNFMKPYQPNKIEKANELYDKLSLGNLDIDVIEEIEQKIKELYQ